MTLAEAEDIGFSCPLPDDEECYIERRPVESILALERCIGCPKYSSWLQEGKKVE